MISHVHGLWWPLLLLKTLGKWNVGYRKMCFRKIRKIIAFQEISISWKILGNKGKNIFPKIEVLERNVFPDFPRFPKKLKFLGKQLFSLFPYFPRQFTNFLGKNSAEMELGLFWGSGERHRINTLFWSVLSMARTNFQILRK